MTDFHIGKVHRGGMVASFCYKAIYKSPHIVAWMSVEDYKSVGVFIRRRTLGMRDYMSPAKMMSKGHHYGSYGRHGRLNLDTNMCK